MKSSSITGLAFAFIPDDSTDQKTLTTVNNLANDIIKSSNNFYLFEGPMPDAETLQTYNDSVKLLNDYGSKLITKLLNIDIKYTYDFTTRTRKLQKFPVDAKTLASAVTGTVGWCAIELNSIQISSPYKCFLFTDAIGGWDDANQSILVSATNVTAGENITIKDINITLRDSLLVDLLP